MTHITHHALSRAMERIPGLSTEDEALTPALHDQPLDQCGAGAVLRVDQSEGLGAEGDRDLRVFLGGGFGGATTWGDGFSHDSTRDDRTGRSAGVVPAFGQSDVGGLAGLDPRQGEAGHGRFVVELQPLALILCFGFGVIHTRRVQNLFGGSGGAGFVLIHASVRATIGPFDRDVSHFVSPCRGANRLLMDFQYIPKMDASNGFSVGSENNFSGHRIVVRDHAIVTVLAGNTNVKFLRERD